MIEKLIEFSIRNRFLVLIVAAVADRVGPSTPSLNTPMDAIPDLSENQVIVFTDWMGRSPREIEDQITYPLSLKLQGLAGVKAVRSSSEFNFSMITLIFEDNVDFYFARERVLERLTLASTFLAARAWCPTWPPTPPRWARSSGTRSKAATWTRAARWALQKYYVGPEINSVPGVAEVGTVGGMPLEYQIDVDPNALRAYGITLGELYEAVAKSNSAVGGRVVQKNNAEYIVRGVGWIGTWTDGGIVRDKSAGHRKHGHHAREPGRRSTSRTWRTVQVGPQFRRSVYREGRQRGRRRRGDDALRREPAGRHRPRSSRRSRNCSRACRRRPHRSRLRPHAPDPRRHPQL